MDCILSTIDDDCPVQTPAQQREGKIRRIRSSLYNCIDNNISNNSNDNDITDDDNLGDGSSKPYGKNLFNKLLVAPLYLR
jgi:hypothetical protein